MVEMVVVADTYILKGNKSLWTLFHLKFARHVKAGHGGDGGSSRSTGHDGEDKYDRSSIRNCSSR